MPVWIAARKCRRWGKIASGVVFTAALIVGGGPALAAETTDELGVTVNEDDLQTREIDICLIDIGATPGCDIPATVMQITVGGDYSNDTITVDTPLGRQGVNLPWCIGIFTVCPPRSE